MLAYRPAFWFPDTTGYLQAARTLRPFVNQQLGYAIFLRMVHFDGATLAVVSGLQHLMTLGLAVLCYAFLYRRGCPRWLSAIVLVPILFDSSRLTLEHYVMSDTLFTTLLMTGIIALLWSEIPTQRSVALAGGLIGLACVTRLVALPVAALLLFTLLLRRAGRPHAMLFVLAVTAPILANMVLFYYHHDAFALSKFQGSFLYGRVSNFVDCSKMDLRPELVRLCPYETVDRRLYPDYYFWGAGAPRNLQPDPPSDKLIHEFAMEAIKQQPGDYARTVSTDLWHFVDPTWTSDLRSACYANRYHLPVHSTQFQSPAWGCQTLLASSNHSSYLKDPKSGNNWLTHSLNWYSRHSVIPGPLAGLATLLCLSALFFVRSRVGFEAVLLAACGLSLVAVATATVMFEWRYLQPALIPLWMGAALAIQAFRVRRQSRQRHSAAESGRQLTMWLHGRRARLVRSK